MAYPMGMRKSFVFLILPLVLLAQETADTATDTKIRQEETEHSQVMKTLHVLTDRWGPRLTGSPNFEGAAKWAVSTMTEWGLKNAHLEPWDFGHPGWLNERAAGYMTAPVNENLKFEVLAWTPSTQGVVKASSVEVVPPKSPTKEELDAWLAANRSKIAGKMVLVGKAAVIPVNFNPPKKRLDDAEAQARFDPNNPQAGQFRGPRAAPPTPEPGKLTNNQVNEALDAWLVANGALVRINDAEIGRAHV